MESSAPQPSDDDMEILRAFLATRDAACPACEYNLRNLQSPRCPECGEALALHVQLVETKQAAPIAGLIGLSAGAGFNALLLVYIVIMLLIRGGGPPRGFLEPFIIVNIGGLVVVSLLIFSWLRRWRKIRMMSPPIRWSLAGACWIISLIDLFIFTASIS